MTQTDFDFFIIGGGQAGVPLAWELAKAGGVALAERKQLGGSCVNFGCTPTKAAIASAKLAHQARRAQEFGITIPEVKVDFPAVIERARRVAGESRNGLDQSLEPSDNPKLLRGHAKLLGRDANGFALQVGEHRVSAGQVILNTGTRSFIPPIEGIVSVPLLTSENWLDNTVLPEHIAILGGGYIGLEMGQFYRRMGSDVTIIENSSHILAHEDRDVSAALQELLSREGIEFRLNTKIERIVPGSGSEIHLHLTSQNAHEIDSTAPTVTVSHLFVATGRVPNTDDLGLESIGLKTADHGYIAVDERLATSISGVWAAGDIRGGFQFTHTSWDDYRILASQITGDKSKTTHRVVPYAVFTDPELGRVGLTESDARATGQPIKTARFEMTHSGKASEIGEENGFIKVIVNAQSGILLGAAVLCADAAELVHIYSDAIRAGLPYSSIRDGIYLHPTLGEAIQSAVTALDATGD